MIQIKDDNQIQTMVEGGKILGRILSLTASKVTPGVNTKDLDEFAENEIRKAGGFPIFKGYHGFPTTLCTCINSEVVHGSARPGRVLQEGDIFSIDIGMRYPAKKGLITDTALTVPVGKISKEEKKLIDVTKQSLQKAIDEIKPGINLGRVSSAIQMFVEKNNFNVVRELVGHGVGEKLHEEPQIPNYGPKEYGPVLQAGMTLAIEPMVTAGDYTVTEDKKTRAYKTTDGSLSAHFEHTVLVTADGAQILTINH